jgi:hypothetical protein
MFREELPLPTRGSVEGTRSRGWGAPESVWMACPGLSSTAPEARTLLNGDVKHHPG